MVYNPGQMATSYTAPQFNKNKKFLTVGAGGVGPQMDRPTPSAYNPLSGENTPASFGFTKGTASPPRVSSPAVPVTSTPAILNPTTTGGRPSVFDMYDAARSSAVIPDIQAPTNYAPKLQEMFAAQKPITGLGQDYFTRERDARTQALKDQFFGELGVAQQTASGEGAAGRLGSGVGTRVMQEAVAKPYAQGLTTIYNDIGQAQAQEAARVETANQENERYKSGIIATALAADSQNPYIKSQAMAAYNQHLDQVYQNLALGEAGLLDQGAYNQAQLQAKAIDSVEQLKQNGQQIAASYAGITASPADWALTEFKRLLASGATLEDIHAYREMWSDSSPEFEQMYNEAMLWATGAGIITIGPDGTSVKTNIAGWNDE